MKILLFIPIFLFSFECKSFLVYSNNIYLLKFKFDTKNIEFCKRYILDNNLSGIIDFYSTKEENLTCCYIK